MFKVEIDEKARKGQKKNTLDTYDRTCIVVECRSMHSPFSHRIINRKAADVIMNIADEVVSGYKIK